MATDLEKLVVQLSADMRGFQREMLKAQGGTDKAMRGVERRFILTPAGNIGRQYLKRGADRLIPHS